MAVLKLLRNQTLYATHEAALTAIDQMADNLHDGELWVATYGTSPNAKSILALKRTDGLTIFDNETSSDAITAVINALDATVKDGLDSVDDTQVAKGKHVGVKVVETDGKLVSISVVEDDIASAALLGTTSDTSSNQTAFGYIAKEVADRTAAIQALDKSDTPEAKKFVTSVSETDGIISVMRGSVTSTDKTITLTDGTDGGINLAVNVDGTTIVKPDGKLAVGTVPAAKVSVGAGTGLKATDAQNAFKELKSAIDDVEGAAKSYTIVKQTDGLDSKVREQYRLQQTVGSTTEFVGDTIQIYKDSAYKEIYLGTANDTVDPVTGTITKAEGDKQSLNYVYIKADGTYDIANVDVSNFLAESEFKDGLVVTDHVVKVKVDASSEGFLTVGENGVKLSGVKAAIDAAVAALDVTDAASEGMYVSAVSETDGKVAISRANVSDAVLNGYAKGSAPLSGQEAVAATDDVKGAIAKLEHQVDAALKTADDAMLTGVTGSNAITVSAKTNKNQTISLKLDTTTKPTGFTNADNVLSVTSEGLYLSSIIDCGTY